MPTFVLHARRTPHVLVRVLAEFHKRAIEIDRLTAELGKNRKVLRISIVVGASLEVAWRMEANLQKTVEVARLEVRE